MVKNTRNTMAQMICSAGLVAAKRLRRYCGNVMASLAALEREDGAGKAHQQPAAHVGGLGAHSGDPRAHFAATEEIILFAAAAVTHKEEQPDCDDQNEIENKCE